MDVTGESSPAPLAYASEFLTFDILAGPGLQPVAVVQRGRLRYANAACAALMGHGAKALARMTCRALIDPAAWHALLNDLQAVRWEGGPARRAIPLRAPGGRSRRIDALLWPVQWNGAPALALMAAETGDTAAPCGEAPLDQDERFAIIGKTIAGAAHHIKTIAYNLRGSASLLGAALASGDGATVETMWRIVSRNLERLTVLSTAMLHYTRDAEPRLESVAPAALLREAHENCLASASAAFIDLALDVSEGLPLVHCDRQAIGDAVLNLIWNALEACEGGGRVTLGARRAGDMLHLTIADNGPGVDPRRRRQIFEPFFTTKGSKGNGMGLAMVLKIVHEHGGTVELQSEPGQTVFTIALPVAETNS